jgi:hypothetical protein
LDESAGWRGGVEERSGGGGRAGGGIIKPIELDANTKAALEELQRYLGTRVYLRPKSGTRPGQLILEYYEEAQLTEIYDRLMR